MDSALSPLPAVGPPLAWAGALARHLGSVPSLQTSSHMALL